ncbi:MAG TPA: transporter substrate-binding domain-containing protein [Flexilinea sp.]|jgi:ABC-type amino acid transport substrate-binding protein|nr:transporter substrate-binding domain-containing protein [Flexilinea sp.]OQA24996.1 MAG: ABC transporter arginine-binding protein 1 precursor [Chloroflexi bacterium ADurb.Bin344]HNY18586.1 transporter substrate-binding domain-containing protein [Flexilinea sp.]HNY94759.1 transporter substrate-binding domain-containing protein [Flexilinea sp.]HOG59885.1 transporter substrate-binding domain-containing protein [Flexilinea sp.]
MKKGKLFIVAIVSLSVLSVLLSGFISVKPQDKQEFKVGLECNYAPFNWTQLDDSNGAIKIKGGGGYCNGYDVAIAKIIADGLNRELVLVKTEWDGLIPALNAGKIDAVIAGMSPTKERKASVDFSDPYYESDLVIVVKKDSPYANAKSLQDFSGARITAQLNTFHYTVIDQIPGVKKQTAMESFPAMIVALSSGKIDGYISERPGAISAMESNPDLTFVEFEEGKGFETSPEDVAIAVALKKGNPDLEAINKIISTITKEKRQEIMDNAIAIQPLSGE